MLPIKMIVNVFYESSCMKMNQCSELVGLPSASFSGLDGDDGVKGPSTTADVGLHTYDRNTSYTFTSDWWWCMRKTTNAGLKCISFIIDAALATL